MKLVHLRYLFHDISHITQLNIYIYGLSYE